MAEREKLYKYDLNGRIRQWWIEYDDEKYRTHSGVEGGAIVSSGWQYPIEKNVGKLNETSIAEQVLAEVESKYKGRQYQGKYHPSIEEASKGAKFIECMLAQKFDFKKNKAYPYYSQPKLDGVRCLVSEAGMQTRNGKEFKSSPHIRNVLDDFFEEFPGYILDGELYNHGLKEDFEKLISLARKTKPTLEDLEESEKYLEFHVYDVISPEEMSFTDRLKFIRNNIAEKYRNIVVVDTCVVINENEVIEKLGEYTEAGYEGQMIRSMDASYQHRRSEHLLKHKEFEDAEFKIVEILEGKGNWKGYCKTVTIRLENGETQRAGIRGTFSQGKEVLKNKELYKETDATVRFQNRTSDGKLRFPVIVKLWGASREH